MNNFKINDCTIIELPRIQNRAGNITPVSNFEQVPFKISRVFYIYDIPGGEDRGAHAHKQCHQFLIAASGSFEIDMDDGEIQMTEVLNRPYYGLYIPPGIWAAEKRFSSGSICLVLTSHKYDETDYLRNYHDFLNFKKNV